MMMLIAISTFESHCFVDNLIPFERVVCEKTGAAAAFGEVVKFIGNSSVATSKVLSILCE